MMQDSELQNLLGEIAKKGANVEPENAVLLLHALRSARAYFESRRVFMYLLIASPVAAFVVGWMGNGHEEHSGIEIGISLAAALYLIITVATGVYAMCHRYMWYEMEKEADLGLAADTILDPPSAAGRRQFAKSRAGIAKLRGEIEEIDYSDPRNGLPLKRTS